jgi:hypothetical protein
LLAVAGLSFLVVFGRLFIGRSSGRSLRAWLASIALFATWTWLALTTNSSTGAIYRVQRDLEHFQDAIRLLSQDDFSKRIQMDSGDVITRVRLPRSNDQFSIKYAEPYSVREPIAIGFLLDAETYIFLLQSRRYTVEYHPNGQIPTDLSSDIRVRLGDLLKELQESTDLGEGWWLTRYRFAGE